MPHFFVHGEDSWKFFSISAGMSTVQKLKDKILATCGQKAIKVEGYTVSMDI